MQQRRARAARIRADPVAELVPRLREREGEVRVKALQPLGASRPTDAELERASTVGADTVAGELAPDLPLPLGRVLDAGGERRVGGGLVPQRSTPPRRVQRDAGDDVRQVR